ncbi:MAG: RNA polymerase sigma factor SigJ [Chromatiales bacterium]|nr:RNA polymerase sigma factor SigJ [Chromatiales bacterium]
MLDQKTAIFEQNRSTLEGIAYRMLGMLAEAQDIVQDTYLKWQETDLDTIQNPRAWLITVCSRLALNAANSARMQRENYVGTWLPEPFIHNDVGQDISTEIELDETLSVALLLALEKLSPTERAIYLLHDIFDYPFDEIAAIVDKSSANCRQIASRTRKSIQQRKSRFQTSAHQQKDLLTTFLQAIRAGELEPLKGLLAAEAKLYADGGGKAEAAADILCGAQEIGAFFIHIWEEYARDNISIHLTHRWFNGSPGLLVFENTQLATALTIDMAAGKIENIYAIRNPDKLISFNPGRSDQIGVNRP